ncbi:MFS transporter, partial [Sinorhizobium meliloti]
MTVNVSLTVMFLLISFGTILGIAGTDLVLPAIPAMPTALG